MKRKTLNINGKTLSYLDNDQPGQALVCLHGHFGCGAMFSFLDAIHDGRLILPDQRGHGQSDHCASYRTDDYVADLETLIRHEGITNPFILGHSLGGTNAMRYAALGNPVKALIIEDIGTEVNCSNEFALKLPPDFASLHEVKQAFTTIGMELDPYFLESIRYDGLRWKFQFDYQDMVLSQQEMNGSHQADWAKMDCPILLLHGTKSWACATANIQEMADTNLNAQLAIYEGAGHTLHDECRDRFSADVGAFLKQQ